MKIKPNTNWYIGISSYNNNPLLKYCRYDKIVYDSNNLVFLGFSDKNEFCYKLFIFA